MRVVPLGEEAGEGGGAAGPPPTTTTAAPARLAWTFTAPGTSTPSLALLGGDGRLRALALPTLTPLPPAAGVGLGPALGLGGGGGRSAGPLLGAGSAADGSALLVGAAGEWVRVGLSEVVEEAARGAPVQAGAEAPGVSAPPPPPPPPAQPARAPPSTPSTLLPSIIRDAATGVLGTLAAAAGAGAAPAHHHPLPRLEAVLGGPRLVAVMAESPPEGEAGAARAALLAGASRPAGRGGAPGPRSAADIRAAYGRPLPGEAGSRAGAGSAAGAVSSVLGEAAAALGRRGDALAALAFRTEGIAEDAAGFESMAREIRRREEGKKWWQLF